MENLFIEKTTSSPEINFDPISGICQITGISMPEDVKIIYTPALIWLDDFGKSTYKSITFNFNFIYFNTASSKIILDILMRLDGLSKLNKEITINWLYKAADLDMEEAVEDYADMISLPIKLIKL